MSTHLNSINTAKAEWDALQPISAENERRLWQKLRLEWNYHSNHIEGNTLTYGETALLLLHGQTHGNHTLREYEEMKAHDVGIEHLRNLAADKARLINPGDIRDLNKIILKEPFWKPTQTPDGQPSRARVIPGEYKTLPNSVITATGELFEYASPMEVPARMQALVDWLGEALADPKLNILTIVARLHHEFVLIHPFDDGNGRVARMLVNYLFLRDGYPPIIVPTERKKDYLIALRLADAGDISALADFLGSCLIRSLELGIRAAKGESVEEPGDLEKEITVFIREQDLSNSPVIVCSIEAIQKIFKEGINELIDELRLKAAALNPLFLSSQFSASAGNFDGMGYESLEDNHKAFETFIENWDWSSPFLVNYSFHSFRGKANEPFDYCLELRVEFDTDVYRIVVDNRDLARHLYSVSIESEERRTIAEEALQIAFQAIKTLAESAL